MSTSVTLKGKSLASQTLCPRCSNQYVKRVRRVGLGEYLLSLFYIYPFRCQLCARRFKVLQWGVTYTRLEEGRREHDRLPAKFPIKFTVRGGDATGSTVDISMCGCSFDTEIRLVKGIILSAELQLPDQIPPVKIQGAVIRSVRPGRASVEFLRIERGERERLEGFVRSLMQYNESQSPAGEVTEAKSNHTSRINDELIMTGTALQATVPATERGVPGQALHKESPK
jgi:hypothetical protein